MVRSLFVAALLLALGACSKAPEGSQPNPGAKPATARSAAKAAAPAPADPAAEARKIFDTRCAACHGKSGTGNGAAAVNLPVKPRNYTDAAWQASVKDDYLMKVIVEGGASVGKSPLMAPNLDLEGKPKVVAELVKIVRAFVKK